MKLSIAWIFDHIQGSFKNHDIPALVRRISTTVCEVEECSAIRLDLDQFVVGVCIGTDADKLVLECSEIGSKIQVVSRTDAIVGKAYLLKKAKNGFQWAEQVDFGSQKEGLMPEISLPLNELNGSWKKHVEMEDYIIEIDNVSLTHRPDLWSHRGFAREIAALLGLPMIHIDEFVASVAVESFPKKSTYASDDLSLKIEDSASCRRFAATLIPEIVLEGSWFWMAHRLARVEVKVINSVVDATNYVMLDVGQPLHAFDGNKVAHHELIVRRAKEGEMLTLLDGQDITLGKENLIVSDVKAPLALAGIMGGASSAVTLATRSLIIESASFAPSRIRKSSSQFKLRTEASARFEKNIDPNQNVDALLRFIFLLEENAQSFQEPELIISLGIEQEPIIITLTHAAIEAKLGLRLSTKEVEDIFSRLNFEYDLITKDPYTYALTVPSFRGTKDITIPEDVIEEIVRLYGLDKIPHELPALKKQASDLQPLLYKDAIIRYCAYAAGMNEVQTYAFFDESIVREFDWQPPYSIALCNPVSENYYRLVTSLVPNLLAVVKENKSFNNSLSFFEINAIWSEKEGSPVQDKSLAGIFFEAKDAINFYDKKAILEQLFHELALDIVYEKAEAHQLAAWYHPYKTMRMMHNGVHIGYAGIAHPGFMSPLGGSAFIFELDAAYLMQAERSIITYKALHKYQDTWLDVSMLAPTSCSADSLKKIVQSAHPAIFKAILLDFFEKPEWRDHRSITLRYFARDEHKTFTGPEIDAIALDVKKALEGHGVQIR